jgi:hypothetical protein
LYGYLPFIFPPLVNSTQKEKKKGARGGGRRGERKERKIDNEATSVGHTITQYETSKQADAAQYLNLMTNLFQPQ